MITSSCSFVKLEDHVCSRLYDKSMKSNFHPTCLLAVISFLSESMLD